nr:hypothetical protein [Tanacetum cinerariifolium]
MKYELQGFPEQLADPLELQEQEKLDALGEARGKRRALIARNATLRFMRLATLVTLIVMSKAYLASSYDSGPRSDQLVRRAAGAIPFGWTMVGAKRHPRKKGRKAIHSNMDGGAREMAGEEICKHMEVVMMVMVEGETCTHMEVVVMAMVEGETCKHMVMVVMVKGEEETCTHMEVAAMEMVEGETCKCMVVVVMGTVEEETCTRREAVVDVAVCVWVVVVETCKGKVMAVVAETCRCKNEAEIYEDMASHTAVCVSLVVVEICRCKNEEEIYEYMVSRMAIRVLLV